MTINYALAKKQGPSLKAALTRAIKSGDPDKVWMACDKAVRAWEEWGAWPDDWSRWQRALDDACGYPNRAPRLEDL